MMLKTPLFWYKKAGFLSYLLLPLAILYWIAQSIYQRIASPQLSPLPSICVGNLVAGGSGKTPVVQALTLLLKNKANSFIIMRGYGRKSCGTKMVSASDDYKDVGDEALLHARHFHTIISSNRLKSASLAKEKGGNVILLDDGLQNITLKPDINFLVVDGDSGFGNGFLLPAGPLRQTPSSARKNIDAIIAINGQHKDLIFFKEKPVFTGSTIAKANIQKERSVIGFSGIARPEKFKKTLQDLSFNLVDFHAYPDHYPFKDQDIKNLLLKARQKKALLITTEKDAIRIPDKNDLLSIALVKLQFQFDDPSAILNFILRHEKFSSLS